MNKCAMQCWATFVLQTAVAACSSPPMGIDLRASGTAGSGSDVVHSNPAPNALDLYGSGGSLDADAGSDAPKPVAAPGAPPIDAAVVVFDALVPSDDAARQSGHVSGSSDAGDIDGWVVERPGQQPDGDRAVGQPDSANVRPADAGPAPDVEPSVDSNSPEGGVADNKKKCVPTWCGTHSWACWRMPNSPNSSLPNPANYTDMGDGTVRDNVTCLIWQKVAPATTAYTWNDAKLKCTDNPLLGGTGWRLPTRIELVSIVDYSRVGPAVPVSVFPSTQLNPPYWTVSAFAGAPQSAYMIGFNQGILSYAEQGTMYFARCVRGNGESSELPIAAPRDHYDIGTDEVKDNYTGLVWQRDDSHTLMSSAISWQQAATYCSTLNLHGSSWRLPSVKELATLIDESQLDYPLPAVDVAAFLSTSASDYWTSTPVAQSHWSVSFRDGTHNVDKASAFVRCVR